MYIEPDTDPLIRETRAAQASIARLKPEDTGKDGARASSTFSSTSRRAAGAFAGAAAGVGGAVASILSLTQLSEAISTTETLAKSTRALSENFGLSVKTSSEWAATAYVRGVDSAKLGMAFKTLATQIAQARDGSDSAAANFKKLGFSQDDLQRGAEDTSFLLTQVADGLKGLQGGADKASISGRLFGRGWQSVAPVLRDGAAEMDRTLHLASKYGATFDGEALTSINDLIGAQRELQFAQLGLQVQFTRHLAPSLMDVLLEVAHYARRTMNGKGAIADFVRVIKAMFSAVRWTVTAVGNAAEFVGDLFGGMRMVGRNLKEARRSLANTKGPIEAASRSAKRILGRMGDIFTVGARVIGRMLRPVGSVFRNVAEFLAEAVGSASSALDEAASRIPVISVDLPSLKKEAYAPPGMKGPIRKQHGGPVKLASGGIVPVPGFPGERINSAALPAWQALSSRYKLYLTDAYGPGHASAEHTQYGTAVDVVPNTAIGGSWGLVTQAVAASVRAGYNPVYYDGSGGSINLPPHGPGHHAHITILTAAELLSGQKPGGPAGPSSIPRIRVKGRGPLANMSQDIADNLRAKANRYLASIAPAVAPKGEAASSGNFDRDAAEAIRITGHHDFTVGGLRTLAQKESGLNPNAVNSRAVNGEHASGYMQMLPSTFRAYHEPGTSNNIFDGVANIAASINYQAARYGGQITFSPYQHGGAVDGSAPPAEPNLDKAFAGLEDDLRKYFDNRRALSEDDGLAVALTGLAF